MKPNWFGKPPHPSDTLVHWTDTKVIFKDKFEDMIATLRNDWDLLVHNDVEKEALERLLYKAAENRECEIAENESE